ncbi:MAG: hypothetical protein ACYDGR_01530 [Candidatus Dormibacteria bacterium]
MIRPGRSIQRAVARAGLVTVGAALVTVAGASAVFANVDSPCHATVYVTPSKPDSAKGAAKAGGQEVVIDSTSIVNVPHYSDFLSGVGDSGGVVMGSGEAGVAIFGGSITIASGSGSGSSGEGGPISAGEISDKLPGPLAGTRLAREITVIGSATPKDGGAACKGEVTFVWQDVSAIDTLAGKAGALLAAIGGGGGEASPS